MSVDFEEVATSSCSEVIIIMSNDFFQPVANSFFAFLVAKKSSAFACISSQGSLQMINENSNSNP